MEKRKPQVEQSNASREFAFKNELKKSWADELIIAYRELAFQIERNEKRVAEFIIPNNDNCIQFKG